MQSGKSEGIPRDSISKDCVQLCQILILIFFSDFLNFSKYWSIWKENFKASSSPKKPSEQAVTKPWGNSCGQHPQRFLKSEILHFCKFSFYFSRAQEHARYGYKRLKRLLLRNYQTNTVAKILGGSEFLVGESTKIAYRNTLKK